MRPNSTNHPTVHSAHPLDSLIQAATLVCARYLLLNAIIVCEINALSSEYHDPALVAGRINILAPRYAHLARTHKSNDD